MIPVVFSNLNGSLSGQAGDGLMSSVVFSNLKDSDCKTIKGPLP